MGWQRRDRAKEERETKDGKRQAGKPRVLIFNSRMREAACWKVVQTYMNPGGFYR